MAHYRTIIESPLPPSRAFAYMANFANAREWDPNVVEAERLDDGPLGVGSRFRIVSRFAGRRVPLEYRITEFLVDRRVVLEAWSRTFGSVDTITVEPTPSGCRVAYDARLVPKGVARLADPLLHLLFQRVGRAAEESLRRHLTSRVGSASTT